MSNALKRRAASVGLPQQEDLEKKIPLVTSGSSVIGLEVGQVDQGKRVIVQYIFIT